MSSDILITKANGQSEPFDIEKLGNSFKRAKVSKPVADQITHHILQELEEGMTTKEIYRHAFSLLHKLEHRTALRYSLRKAILDLGPSGFPFEQMVAEILKSLGYTTLTDQMVKGRCADHEVDVVAWKPGSLIMSEVKYHGQEGLKSDLKIVLYVKARFDDLSKMMHDYGTHPQELTEGWLVTNTKFTTTAIKYAECQNLKVIGWNYPLDGNLHDFIDAAQLHPLTCLHTLSEHDKKALLDRKIVLCKTLEEDKSILKSIGLSETNAEAVLEEIKMISQ
ncbi:MAG: restriction endonuclease [bacterium]|nr:restriction endonuclease [bacterium]